MTIFEICGKLKRKIPELFQWCHSDSFIFKLQPISNIVIISFWLTLKMLQFTVHVSVRLLWGSFLWRVLVIFCQYCLLYLLVFLVVCRSISFFNSLICFTFFFYLSISLFFQYFTCLAFVTLLGSLSRKIILFQSKTTCMLNEGQQNEHNKTLKTIYFFVFHLWGSK